MYFRKKTSGGRAYLQIVESRRAGAQVRQQVIATLGRIEDLRDSGQLERLLRSGARFAAKAIVVNAVAEGTVTARAARRIGPVLVFERLWEETSCRKVIEDPVLLDGDGRPVCTEMWPGNTADVGSLVPVVDRLRKRFSIQRVCVVADRGMISAETIAELEARGLCYILGVRERSDKLVRDLVLADPAPFIPLTIAKRGKEIDYEAKAVMLAGRRYIVCRNREEMKKDAAARTAILAALERQLKKGDKTLVGNKGYRRFLATPDDDHFVIDRAKAEEDAKFDGIFVLRTNADLSPLETMLCYKHLWMVERAFRTSKSLFATRPIFHKLDETIRGHVSCSFLALVLKKELEDRIATLGHASSWPNVLADLNSLTETEVEQDGKRFLLRTPPRPAASLALRAAGVALPPTVRQLADA